MSKQIIEHYIDFSFLKNFFFHIRVNRALIACNKIESYLLSNKYLTNLDSKLKLVISDEINNKIENSYFLYKGYNIDGSIKVMKKYTIIKEKIIEYANVLNRDIIILDLGNKSIYLHNYSKTSRSINGYLVKEEIKSHRSKTIIFSKEKVRIKVKRIYNYIIVTEVDDFVNKYII